MFYKNKQFWDTVLWVVVFPGIGGLLAWFIVGGALELTYTAALIEAEQRSQACTVGWKDFSPEYIPQTGQCLVLIDGKRLPSTAVVYYAPKSIEQSLKESKP